jgi:hypothetical protein
MYLTQKLFGKMKLTLFLASLTGVVLLPIALKGEEVERPTELHWKLSAKATQCPVAISFSSLIGDDGTAFPFATLGTMQFSLSGVQFSCYMEKI